MTIYLDPTAIEFSIGILTVLVGFQLGFVAGAKLERFRSKWW